MLYKGLYDYLMDSNISFINFVPWNNELIEETNVENLPF
jgi:hypothetical protein